MGWTSGAVIHPVSPATTLRVSMALIHTRMSPCTNLSSLATFNLWFTLPLGQLEEILSPPHSPGSATVESRKLRHLCLVWVEANHQTCQIAGCPSGPSLFTYLSQIPPHRKAGPHCFVLCITAVLSKCPCCCYIRFSFPKTKPSGPGPSCPGP